MNVHFTGRTNGEPKSKNLKKKKRGVDGNTPWLFSPVQKHFKESSMQSPENGHGQYRKILCFFGIYISFNSYVPVSLTQMPLVSLINKKSASSGVFFDGSHLRLIITCRFGKDL